MALGAFLHGIRRVAAAPLVFLGVYAVTLAAALAMALVLREAGPGQPDRGAVLAALSAGWPLGWWPAFAAEASGVARALGPVVAGFTALFPDLSDPGDNRTPAGTLAGLAFAGVAAWTLVAGGTLDRLARQRRAGGAAFFAACRHHFWPLTRLAVLAGGMYWLLFGVLYPGLAGDPGVSTHGLTIAGDASPLRLARYALFGAGVAAVGLVVDYARVRAVVEDRRSMIGALLAALRFARRRPIAVTGLWLLNTALLALIAAGCASMTPGAAAVGPPWGPLLVGQVCIAARLFATLVAWASQTAYFQGQLAHATYVARARVPPPEPISDRSA